jgi:hypothetical protein
MSYIRCDRCDCEIEKNNKGYVSPWDRCWCVTCTEEMEEDDPNCFEDERL